MKQRFDQNTIYNGAWFTVTGNHMFVLSSPSTDAYREIYWAIAGRTHAIVNVLGDLAD